MRLSNAMRVLDLDGEPAVDPVITGVCVDSRQMAPGNVFVAIRGFATDGHKFIDDAIARGASAVVLEDDVFAPDEAEAVATLKVANCRRAAAVLADEFHGHPSRDLTLVGVTGTNGKTTVTVMLDSIFGAAGQRTGIIGTLGRSIDGAWREGDRTTPDPVELQGLLADMRTAGVTHVAMEVSSHALDLERVHMCCFAGAVFTNLSQDHLDYHPDLDEYLEAKLRLFTTYADFARAERPMVGATNMDDPSGAEVARRARCEMVKYGTNGGSAVRARGISSSADGAGFDLVIGDSARPVKLALAGHFNVHNALAAAAICHGLGFSIDHIVTGLQAVKAVPGRFERVDEGQPYTVIVDYAHTADALSNLLDSARALSPKRLLCVMGCGGDRDRGKRPKMGKVAAEKADLTIITSDNPRTEDPAAIIEDIRGGVDRGEHLTEVDRRQAIFAAIGMCEPGDMVLIAGKGHETYQEFADHRIHFDDREVAREAIRAGSA